MTSLFWRVSKSYSGFRFLHTYRLKIFTGDHRGAGTNAVVNTTLFGEKGESKKLHLDPEDDIGTVRAFKRNSSVELKLSVDEDLGRIKSLKIGHDASTVGSGWFLDKVVVEDESLKETVEFPLGQWLGPNESGAGKAGPPTTILFPAHSSPKPSVIEGMQISGPLRIRSAACCFPHPDKVRDGIKGKNGKYEGYGGEDAYFISPRGVMGVADGVFGWRSQGIDAGLYSRSLMSHCREFVEKTCEIHQDREMKLASPTDLVISPADPFTVLTYAYERVTKDKVLGSSTVCVVSLHQVISLMDANRNKSLLKFANLGDSAFLIARPTPQGIEVIYRSPQQDKVFGTPYQIGHHPGSDSLTDALVSSVPIFHGDIVVMGTDGLWDNAHDEEIIEHIKPTQENKFVTFSSSNPNKKKIILNPHIDDNLPFWSGNPLSVAQSIAKFAFGQSISRSTTTPFSLAASEELNIVHRGGKTDDLTVLVGFIEADVDAI